mmetsp:Transcript_23416/g.41619  ORF Transcript_23416/g.41619 Transcript_23416/m.41619 type:complete len:202 (-) Transcript_23416:2421-3026(-)
MPIESARRRSSFPSLRSASSLVEVIMTRLISWFFIRSMMLGRPSWILRTISQGTPVSRRYLAVPEVATKPKPRLPRSRAIATTSFLCLSATDRKTFPCLGSFWPAAIWALAKAAAKVLSMPMTSPVERISGPRRVSAPGNLLKGRTTSLTATWGGWGSSVKLISWRVLPDMRSEAYLAMGCPTALATKGTVRDARGLASMM